MKTFISLASLACALSLGLHAQVAATLNHLPNGADQIKIRNDSSSGLVAYVVSAKQVPRNNDARPPFLWYADPSVDPVTKPLLPGEERVISERIFQGPGGQRLITMEEPIITAGVLADGTTVGDGVLLTRLMFRRSSMLLAVETTLETLSDAGRHNISRDQLLGQFKKLADSLHRSYLFPEQQIGLGLYQSMIGKLMSLSEGPLGTPFPPAAFVQQETAALLQQRRALSESQPSLMDGPIIAR